MMMIFREYGTNENNETSEIPAKNFVCFVIFVCSVFSISVLAGMSFDQLYADFVWSFDKCKFDFASGD